MGYGERRTLEGVERECPVARAVGQMGRVTRWIHIRDGLKATIEMLPVEDRRLAALLQRAWALACAEVEDQQAGEPPRWLWM